MTPKRKRATPGALFHPSGSSRGKTRTIRLGQRSRHRVERFGARPRVALGGPGARVAEEVAQREAVDAFACEGAREGVTLIVEAEAPRDAGECLGGLEVALDR